MKSPLFLVGLLLPACATVEGTNPRTGAQYKATLVMTDLAAFSIGASGAKAAGMVQSVVPNKLIETAGVAYGVGVLASVQKAADAGSNAVAIGAQKADVAKEGIAAGVEKARIGADVTKAIIIPK